jgi:hypothetical protein
MCYFDSVDQLWKARATAIRDFAIVSFLDIADHQAFWDDS